MITAGALREGDWFDRMTLSTLVYLFCITLVPDHLLDEELGFPIRICAASSWVLFIDGEFLRIAVHRR